MLAPPAPDLEAELFALLLLELGVEVDAGPELAGVPANRSCYIWVLLTPHADKPGEISSLVAPLDFRLDFLLETLLR